MKDGTKMEVSFGDGFAVIRREGHSAPIVARVLGREREGRGETVYLDRLVHDESNNWGEWGAHGAISTILTRTLPATAEV